MPERGQAMEGLLVLAALSIIIFVFILPARGVNPAKGFYALQQAPAPGLGQTAGGQTPLARTSAYSASVTLGSGDASYEVQPYAEYITLTNNSSAPIDITGWKIENAKGARVYTVGNNAQAFPSDIATIPRAPATVPLSGQGILQDIVLHPNDRAILTSGAVGNADPYRVTNFKENECTGYLERLPTYQQSFVPQLSLACVPPQNEPGFATLDPSCQSFIRGNLSACQTPTYDDLVTDPRTGQQNVCNGCVNKHAGLSSACVTFIKTHYSYAGCLAYHQNDPDFFGGTWHIFLGRTFEMWAPHDETISLIDTSGKLVDYISWQ